MAQENQEAYFQNACQLEANILNVYGAKRYQLVNIDIDIDSDSKKVSLGWYRHSLLDIDSDSFVGSLEKFVETWEN